MKANTLELFEIFKKALNNEEDAKTVVKYLEDANETEIVRTVERKIEHLATKEDLGILRTDMESLRTNMESLRTNMESLRTDMERVKSDIIKWMFIFWVGQFAVILGIGFAIVKFFQ